MYRLSELPDPPRRLVLGKDVVEFARNKIASFGKEVEESVPWSEGLDIETA